MPRSSGKKICAVAIAVAIILAIWFLLGQTTLFKEFTSALGRNPFKATQATLRAEHGQTITADSQGPPARKAGHANGEQG